MSEDKKEDVVEDKAATPAEAAPEKKEAKPAEETKAEAKAEETADAPAEAAPAEEATEAPAPAPTDVKLTGLIAQKLGMSSFYTEDGNQTPVTVLKLNKWHITQIKTTETDGYDAVQVSMLNDGDVNLNKAQAGHLKKAGFEKKTPAMVKEFRQDIPEEAKVGMEVSWETLAKGDRVRMTGTSKGRGFAGVMKRYNFGGGPAAHGSTFHRQPGSVGNRTWPGRIMPGKKLPGHYGDATVTVKNVEVVDVQLDDGLLLVKGPVPGARNSYVQLLKQ